MVGEDFRSLLYTNSEENSEMTIKTTRMISEEITNQVSRRLNEIKDSLNFRIQDAITTAITKKVLPFIQNTLETRGRANCTVSPAGQKKTQGRLISPQWTKRPVGYNGPPKSKIFGKCGKIAPERISCGKTI